MGRLSVSIGAFVLLMFLSASSAFAPPVAPHLMQRGASSKHNHLFVQRMTKDDDDDDVSDDGDMDTFASQRSTRFFVEGIQSAFVAAAWAFLAIGFILNLFGYDYVMKDGKLSVDTLEASQFQQEVIKASKSE